TGVRLGERSPVMDDETAAKYVLLDFELIALIALALGVLAYGVARRLRRAPADASTAGVEDYDGFDLALALFPAMLFLLNPIAAAIVAGKGEGGASGEPQPSGIGISLPLINL